VIVDALQKFIVNFIVPDSAELEEWDGRALASLWNAWLLSVEAPFFSLAIYRAFPASELSRHHADVNVDVDQYGRIELQATGKHRSSDVITGTDTPTHRDSAKDSPDAASFQTDATKVPKDEQVAGDV